MKIHLLVVGKKMPTWVSDGFRDYVTRLPTYLPLVLNEISVAHRGKNPDVERLKRDEGAQLLERVPGGAHVVALDGAGKPWSTVDLSRRLQSWMQSGVDVALLVGGPDGLARGCLDRANERWSLGPLTLPHPLVRVVLAEQLYRAWTILQNHPYHRA